MGSCCTSETTSAYEFDDQTATKKANVNVKAASHDQTNDAVLLIQKQWKGVMTRKLIKEQYGFEA